MKINFTPYLQKEAHRINSENIPQDNKYCSGSSTKLPNYFQMNKGMIPFCGGKNKNYSEPLSDYIGGYKIEKNLINEILIEPLNVKGCNDVPPSLLLGFSDDFTKTSIINSIKKSTGADFVNIDSSGDDLFLEMDHALANARYNYLNQGKRSVIIINDAEKVIGMPPVYAKEYSTINLDEEDLKLLKNSGVSSRKINYFKSLLDHVSEAPFDENDKTRSASSIVFVTKNPQLIHPDLMSRSGKMQTIIFSTAQGKNVKEVFDIEIKKNMKLLDYLKQADSFDNIKGLSSKHIKKIEELKTNGKIKDLNIDYKNIPYNKITDFVTQSRRKGAYSNKIYNEIAQKAFKEYLMNSNIPYSTHFMFSLASTPRDISAQKYQKIESIKEAIATKK